MAERGITWKVRKGETVWKINQQVSNNDHVLLPEVTALHQFQWHNVAIDLSENYLQKTNQLALTDKVKKKSMQLVEPVQYNINNITF